MKTEDIKKALKYLTSFEKLYHFGFVGKFLSEEAEEFRKDKNEHEDLLEWCIRKAKEALKT